MRVLPTSSSLGLSMRVNGGLLHAIRGHWHMGPLVIHDCGWEYSRHRCIQAENGAQDRHTELSIFLFFLLLFSFFFFVERLAPKSSQNTAGSY